jgi:Na+/H+ antiporter NhaA
MGQVYSFVNSGPDLAEAGNIGQHEVLERALAKMILLGKQVGVSLDLMIQ